MLRVGVALPPRPVPAPLRGDLPRARVPALTLERVLWVGAVLLTAVCLGVIHQTATGTFRLSTLDQLAHFQAVEPFQQRILIPALVAGLARLVPATNSLLFLVLAICGWTALVGVAYRGLNVFEVGPPGPARRWLALTAVVPVALLLILPDFRMDSIFAISDQRLDLGSWRLLKLYYYPYDLPAAVFTLALVLMLVDRVRRPAAGRWPLYFAVFALATCNRETTVFVICFYALLFYRRISWPTWTRLLLLHVAVFVAIQIPLHWVFREQINPNANVGSSAYETHLVENVLLFTNPLYLAIFLVRFAGGLYIPLLLWRRYLDRRLTIALIGFGVPLVLSAFVAGRVQEHRVFIELMPLIWLAAMQVIAVRFNAADTVAGAPRHEDRRSDAHDDSLAPKSTPVVDDDGRRSY